MSVVGSLLSDGKQWICALTLYDQFTRRRQTERNMSGGEVSSTFSWLDYGVLVLVLLLSSLVGVYFGCFGAKIKSMAEFLNGDRKLKTIPIAISLIAR